MAKFHLGRRATEGGILGLLGDSLTPPLPNHHDYRKRFLLRLGVIVAISCCIAGFAAAGAGDRLGASMVTAPTVISLALVAATRTRIPISLLGHVLVGTLLVVICMLAGFGGGGLAAPALFVLPCVPAIAALTSGRKSAIVWSGLSMLPAPFFFFLITDSVPTTRMSAQTLDILRVVAPNIAVLLVTATVISYERHHTERAVLLKESQLDSAEAHKDAEVARERAELANQAKTAFLATMSQEIRTPLTAVVGVAEVLRGAGLDARHIRQLALLEGAGRTLLGLVDDILNMSQIETGQLELESEPVNLAAIVREVGDLLQTRAATRGVTLHHSYEGTAFIQGDPLRIRQVLLNLAGNAVKLTEDGTVDLNCQVAERREDALLDVTFTVKDTGVGIQKDLQHSVFHPFTQVEQGTARRFGGSVLGLSIVGQLVHMMEGTIDLQSTPGEGTTITVRATFPRGQEPVAKPRITEVAKAGTLRVLLAEDNEINQEVVRLMLERCGCVVNIASDGFHAVEAIVDAPDAFDLILMDCQMPGMDGFEATRTLRAAGWTRPIVALTANASPADRAECMTAGMDDFTSKPLTLADLRSVLNRHRRPSNS